MTSLDVIVPVLSRPHRVRPLIASLDASVVAEREAGWTISIVFVCTPDDTAEIDAVRAPGYEPLMVGGEDFQFSRKTNAAAAASDATWILTGADDLDFRPGWLTAALRVHEETGALVIGTNDMANPTVIAGNHATHSLVHRDYIALGTIDEPGKVLHEGYDHNACDCELVETAHARGMWAFARDSVIRHLHPTFNRDVKRDPVYMKGLAHARRDRQLLYQRRHLWDPDAPEYLPGAPRVRGVRTIRARALPGPARWPRR